MGKSLHLEMPKGVRCLSEGEEIRCLVPLEAPPKVSGPKVTHQVSDRARIRTGDPPKLMFVSPEHAASSVWFY